MNFYEGIASQKAPFFLGVFDKFFLSVFPSICQADENSPSLPMTQEEFFTTPAWLNLLYYERQQQNFRSLIVNDLFFISEKGRSDPRAELAATVELFQNTKPTEGMHPQCLYPARYKRLRQHFELLPPVSCPNLDTWLSEYQPAGFEIVYTSQFISNPARSWPCFLLSS